MCLSAGTGAWEKFGSGKKSAEEDAGDKRETGTA
jgi:hypothetical protein